MKISKKIGVVSVCVALICALAACNLADMEFGGLVGELLNGSGISGVVPEQQPPVEDTDGWFTQTDVNDVQPGGVPDQIVIEGGEIILYETIGTSQLKDADEDSIVRRTQLEMEDVVWANYNVGMSHKQAETADVMLDVIKSDVLSGSGVTYMCYLPLSKIGDISTSGLFYSNADLPLELNNGCWFTGFNEDLCIVDRQYAFAGYLTPYVQLNVDVLVYNREMLAQYGFDIYNCYYSGQWTLEELYKLSKDMYVDLNSNGQMDAGDQFAVAYQTYTNHSFDEHVFYGSGVELFDKGQMFYKHSEQTVLEVCDLANKLRETSLHATESEAKNLFLNGNAAFYATTLADYAGLDGNAAMVTEASMQTGVVPTPYYITVGGYASHVDAATTPVLAIPRSSSEQIGSALNALSELAGMYYTEAIDTWLYKICPSEEALDLARRSMDNVRCDVDAIMLGAMGHSCNPVAVSAPASYLSQYGKSFEKELTAIYRKVESNS